MKHEIIKDPDKEHLRSKASFVLKPAKNGNPHILINGTPTSNVLYLEDIRRESCLFSELWILLPIDMKSVDLKIAWEIM